MEDETKPSLAERLQEKWLDHMERLLDNGAITSTDLATLARVLMANGWTFDPKKLPQNLAGKLTSKVSAQELEDLGVLPIRRQG